MRRSTVHERAPAAWSIAGTVTVVIGSLLAILAAVPTLAGRLTQDHDTTAYHITNLVTWVHQHSIWELPFQNTGFFTATHPGNGELLAAPMLLATGSDQLVYTVNILFGAIAVLACAMIARELDARPDLGALAALALVGAPIVFGTQAHSLATDLAAAAGVLVGVAALLRARRSRDHRWVTVAGCALGFSMGSKYTTLILVPVIAAVAVAALRPRIRTFAMLVPGIALLAGPWFLRNLVATGNPVFPQAVRFGGVELFPAGASPVLYFDTTILEHLVHRNSDVLSLWATIGRDWHGPMLLVIAAGIGCAILRRRRGQTAAIIALALLAAAVYLVTPFTGGGPDGDPSLVASNIRYTMAFSVLAIALAAAAAPARFVVGLSAIGIAYDIAWMVRGHGFRSDLDLTSPRIGLVVAAAALAVVIAFVVGGGRRIVPSGARLAPAILATAVIASAGLASLDLGRPATALELALAKTDADEILVLGIQDMRSVLGPDLALRARTVSAGGEAGDAFADRREGVVERREQVVEPGLGDEGRNARSAQVVEAAARVEDGRHNGVGHGLHPAGTKHASKAEHAAGAGRTKRSRYRGVERRLAPPFGVHPSVGHAFALEQLPRRLRQQRRAGQWTPDRTRGSPRHVERASAGDDIEPRGDGEPLQSRDVDIPPIAKRCRHR